eukprot:1187774-Prorocentrum_minimum.AAC.3
MRNRGAFCVTNALLVRKRRYCMLNQSAVEWVRRGFIPNWFAREGYIVTKIDLHPGVASDLTSRPLERRSLRSLLQPSRPPQALKPTVCVPYYTPSRPPPVPKQTPSRPPQAPCFPISSPQAPRSLLQPLQNPSRTPPDPLQTPLMTSTRTST